jgi:hypothetical protein
MQVAASARLPLREKQSTSQPKLDGTISLQGGKVWN